ncbi:DUF4352 domain-containing protein [Streptomyces sp. ISL-11]|uniref:DUF4352 domain-containing protein n=1 Tax=Streptomyces sp. ISL-11 TaxID=2819174 RepID=UPI001BEB59A9|nr:DUF4352 domain-containing protein [Streptomyces sp. ISL-11]MBT2386376.1 hypothetical protein [Streptomyces sp. ISL-11]
MGTRRHDRGGTAVPAAALAVAAVLLTGCGDTDGRAGGGLTVSPSSARSSAQGSHVVRFEDTYAYDTGLRVKVTRPKPFTPSDTSLGHKAGNAPVTFTVTLFNGTKETFDRAGALVTAKAGPQGPRLEQVFDSARGVGNPFTGSLAPGSSAEAAFAFDVPKGSATERVDVEVRPDFGARYTSVHWVNRPG